MLFYINILYVYWAWFPKILMCFLCLLVFISFIEIDNKVKLFSLFQRDQHKSTRRCSDFLKVIQSFCDRSGKMWFKLVLTTTSLVFSCFFLSQQAIITCVDYHNDSNKPKIVIGFLKYPTILGQDYDIRFVIF